MMRRKRAVDDFVEQDVAAGKRFGQLDDDLAGGAVAAIPGHLERARAVVILCEARDVIVKDAVPRDLAAFGSRRAELERCLTDLLDRLAEERLATEHQLEAVMVGRVVRAGNHDAAIDP